MNNHLSNHDWNVIHWLYLAPAAAAIVFSAWLAICVGTAWVEGRL